jgi:hypothetical protein
MNWKRPPAFWAAGKRVSPGLKATERWRALGVLRRAAGGGGPGGGLAPKDWGRDEEDLCKIRDWTNAEDVRRFRGRAVVPETGRAVRLDDAAVICVEEGVLGQSEPETGQGQQRCGERSSAEADHLASKCSPTLGAAGHRSNREHISS